MILYVMALGFGAVGIALSAPALGFIGASVAMFAWLRMQ